MKISKFTMINKQIISNPAKQTLIMTYKNFSLLSKLIYNIWVVVNRKGENPNFGQIFFNWSTLPITVM